MDNILNDNQSLNDSDYETSDDEMSDDESEIINYNKINYDNKYFHNNSIQSDYQTIRDKLFTKDIIKQRILIDTHNIIVQGTNTADSLKTNNYTYYLYKNSEEAHSLNENYNETGGYDRYKNVIGFRFIKAMIPNRSYTVNNTNNTFIVQLANDGTVLNENDRNGKFKIILQNGFFDTDTITQSFTNATYEAIADIETTGDTNLKGLYEITPSFNSQNKLFTFTMKDNTASVAIKFKFIWSDVTNNSAQSFLGFNGNTPQFINPIIGDIPPDMSVNYIDLIIDEIPYIACKKNGKGNRLIDRIGITAGLGELFEYTQDWDFQNENYFFPMKLDKLTIKLYETTHNHFFKSDRDHSLEFEITIIKNAKDFDFLIG